LFFRFITERDFCWDFLFLGAIILNIMVKFPNNFFWGAATSSYQVEGNNSNADWWEWEKSSGLKDKSGEACRHYEFYRSDFDLAKELNHNAHRLSIEWSRIQPQEGNFSEEEIRHYIEVINSLKERNLEPFVTLHHFTNPLWFARLGGWQNKKAKGYFLSYVEKLVDALGSKVRFWITINEPLVYVYESYLLGNWPPQEKSLSKAYQVIENLTDAHVAAYGLIHNIYRKNNLASPFVSIAKNAQAFMPCIPTLRNKLATWLRNRLYNLEIIDRLIWNNSLDFIGMNYYSRSLVETKNWSLRSLLLDACEKDHSRLKKNSMGWDIYPEGLYDLLMQYKKYRLPLIILENGVCTEDDSVRWEFISSHLESMHAAMSEGVEVLGYFYWSLLDNFEWDKGFVPRFGLIEMDYINHKRTVRESARKFSEVCRTGILK
jgi:beta-glucosidase